MEMDVEEFRRRFPALFREIMYGGVRTRVSGVRSSAELAESLASTRLPTAIDYLRRCDTDEQGEEVIEFLLKRGEITAEEAAELSKQLRSKGIRSFGSRKQLGHYFREGV
ncbi:MAG: DUF2095 family protein [Candidatus Caldarchaeum sp.]